MREKMQMKNMFKYYLSNKRRGISLIFVMALTVFSIYFVTSLVLFFAYPDNSELDAIVMKYTAREPEYNFVAKLDGFGHTFWIIDEDKDIARITELFGEMPALYIADGHHRSAAAALVGAEKAKQNPDHKGDEEYNYFMAVCFPANQLTIIDYNRVVKDLNGLTEEQFVER